MKKLVAICGVLLIVFIINVHTYNRNEYLDTTQHNYKCTMNMYSEDLQINYDYVFKVLTDNQGHILSDIYYEEFTYNIDDYYYQSKEFYSKFEDDSTRIFDDDKKIIKLEHEYNLSNTYDNYESFKESIENKQFKCEEIL